MPAADQMMQLYRELAEIYDRQGQAQMRDRFLVLAADTAFSAGKTAEAERLRIQLLRFNPHHLLKPYDSFAEAIRSTDVENYISALRRSHPYEKAEHLLETLSNSGAAENADRGSNLRPPNGLASNTSKATPDLQVFRVVDAGDADRPEFGRSRSTAPEYSSPRDKPMTQGARALAPAKRGDPSPRSNIPPNIYAMRQEPGGPGKKAAGFEPAEDEAGFGAWVSVALAVIVFLGGLFIAACTFARPFVPRGWLP